METLSPVPEDSSLATGMDEKLRYCLDADILDCPICTEPLSLPVYQVRYTSFQLINCLKTLLRLNISSFGFLHILAYIFVYIMYNLCWFHKLVIKERSSSKDSNIALDE